MHEISSSAKNTELLILLNVPSDFYQTEEKKKRCFSTHDFLWKANFSVSTKEKKQQQ